MSKLNGWTFKEQEKPSGNESTSLDINAQFDEFFAKGGEIEVVPSKCDHKNDRRVVDNQSLVG